MGMITLHVKNVGYKRIEYDSSSIRTNTWFCIGKLTTYHIKQRLFLLLGC